MLLGMLTEAVSTSLLDVVEFDDKMVVVVKVVFDAIRRESLNRCVEKALTYPNSSYRRPKKLTTAA